jgi:hypothetical protein
MSRAAMLERLMRQERRRRFMRRYGLALWGIVCGLAALAFVALTRTT